MMAPSKRSTAAGRRRRRRRTILPPATALPKEGAAEVVRGGGGRGRLSPDVIVSEILPRLWEILLRLPVKTLCRLRCVSKSWHDLLSGPYFLRLHWRMSKRNPKLLVVAPDYDAGRVTFFATKNNNELTAARGSAADLGFHWDIYQWRWLPPRKKASACCTVLNVSACRGLVLVYDWHSMRVWNPATGGWVHVKIQHSYGFVPAAAIGYAESTGEYKVLVYDGRSCVVLTVGSPGRGWRPAKLPPFPQHSPYRYDACNSVFLNGFIHMLPLSSYEGIARFDVEKEDWSVIPGAADPRLLTPRRRHHDLLLREVNGLLCLVHFDESRCSADVWLLTHYDQGVWVKRYGVDYGSYLRGAVVEPLMIEQGDGRILFACRGSNLLFYYDPTNKTFQEIYKADNNNNKKKKKKFSFMLSTMYAENFASLKRGEIGRTGRCAPL